MGNCGDGFVPCRQEDYDVLVDLTAGVADILWCRDDLRPAMDLGNLPRVLGCPGSRQTRY